MGPISAGRGPTHRTWSGSLSEFSDNEEVDAENEQEERNPAHPPRQHRPPTCQELKQHRTHFIAVGAHIVSEAARLGHSTERGELPGSGNRCCGLSSRDEYCRRGPRSNRCAAGLRDTTFGRASGAREQISSGYPRDVFVVWSVSDTKAAFMQSDREPAW